jgi:hypothetical protein
MVPVVHTGQRFVGPAHVFSHQHNLHAFHRGRRLFQGRGGIFSGWWPIVYTDALAPVCYPVAAVTPTGPFSVSFGSRDVLCLWSAGDDVYWSLNDGPWQATSRLDVNFLGA